MERLEREIGYYFDLVYPLRVIAKEGGFWARYPDLPDCELWDDDLERLYSRMETARYIWIADRLRARRQVPLPNTQRYVEGVGWNQV